MSAPGRPRVWGGVRTVAADGVGYASRDEAARADELRLMVLGGAISSYRPHPGWDLDVPPALETMVAWLHNNGHGAAACALEAEFTPRVVRIARNGYHADFEVIETDGTTRFEDVKGGPPSRDFWLRKWAAEALHGIRVACIERRGRRWEPVEEKRPLTPAQRKAEARERSRVKRRARG